MKEFYRSKGEDLYIAERKALAKQTAAAIDIKNAMLVGEPREYKGISYQMNQRGSYECLDLPPLSGLDGAFTSAPILHSIIDKLESSGNLPKPKVKGKR